MIGGMTEITINKYKPRTLPCCGALKVAMSQGGISYRNLLDGNLYFVADVLTRDKSVDQMVFMEHHNHREDRIETPGEIKKVEYIQGYRVMPLIFSFCPYCGLKLHGDERWWEPNFINIEKGDAVELVKIFQKEWDTIRKFTAGARVKEIINRLKRVIRYNEKRRKGIGELSKKK